MSAVPYEDEPEELFGYLVHPVASWFPLLVGDELQALADDIAENGLVEPPVVSGKWLLDGRNRLRGCELAGVEPDFRVWEGDEADIPAWIISKNVHRRHLGTGQRAMIAARLATRTHADNQHSSGKFAGAPTQGEAAKLLGVSERSVRDARVVLDHGSDELIAKVDAGEVSVSAAAKDARPGWFAPQGSRPNAEPANAPASANPPAQGTADRADPATNGTDADADLYPDRDPPAGEWTAKPLEQALPDRVDQVMQRRPPATDAEVDLFCRQLRSIWVPQVGPSGAPVAISRLRREAEPPNAPADLFERAVELGAELGWWRVDRDVLVDLQVEEEHDREEEAAQRALLEREFDALDEELAGEPATPPPAPAEKPGKVTCGVPHPVTGIACDKSVGHWATHGYGGPTPDKRVSWDDNGGMWPVIERPDTSPTTAAAPAPRVELVTEERAEAPAAPSPLVDLRCCDVLELLASLPDEAADLVIADPPWDYVQRIGATRARNHYACLRVPKIAEHVSAAARVGSRLALWCTFPLLGEWMAAETPWGRPVAGGAWVKSREGDEGAVEEWELEEDDGNGHFGPGYHWAGCAEPVLLYTRRGAYTDRSVPVRNAWLAGPGAHSEKPDEWQAQWIRKWVPPRGLVVDLYAGRGSVARAALLAGGDRRYVGAELDPARHAEALASIVALTAEQAGAAR